ncbi:MAG: hypothetical protein ACRDF4_00670 [Rhabdochlamydiaceae bacterium]
MTYRVITFNYSLEELLKVQATDWRDLSNLTKLLNGEWDKTELQGFKLKQITSAVAGDKMIYTLVLEK